MLPRSTARARAIPVVLTSAIVLVSGPPPAAADDRAFPTPVAIWPAGPLEVVVTFKQPIGAAQAASLIDRKITYSQREAVASDRPASGAQSGAIGIAGARLADDGRTLILATDPHPLFARYALPVARIRGEQDPPGPAEAAVSYDLSGVDVSWSREGDPDGEPAWSGWWPLLDSAATARLTRGSRMHEAGLELLSKPGRVTASTLLRLPPGSFVLRLDAAGPFEEASAGDVQAELDESGSAGERNRVELAISSQGAPIFLTISVSTGKTRGPFSLRATYRSSGESTPHDLEHDQLVVPWAPMPAPPAAAAPLVVPDLAGGDPVRGRSIFHGDQARCAQCHAFRGQGGTVGPDLTDIGRKGRTEIYRSIAAPSASIEPDYLTHTIATSDGQVLVGLVRAAGPDAVRVTDTNAHATLVPRRRIQQVRPSGTSIMPIGLAATFGDRAMRDLIAYLTEEPAPSPGGMARLLSFDELERQLGAPELRLLDLRDHADFAKGHIPGAIWLDIKAAQQLSSTGRGLLDQPAWEKWMEPLGIGPSTQVVVYDAQRQSGAARIWWLLSYLGAPNVALVNGGFGLWARQGRPVTSDSTKAVPRPFRVKFQHARLAGRDQVVNSLKSADVVVDARSAAEYAGDEVRSRRGGHIPSACHLEWSTLVDEEGRFLDERALRGRLDSLRIKSGQPITTYCQSGGRSSVDVFVLERLGFPVRNYYLGWSDWGNAEDSPIETGKDRDIQKNRPR
jgi:thiosulfate/3-mercaptopyruvate sulfurtransferase